MSKLDVNDLARVIHEAFQIAPNSFERCIEFCFDSIGNIVQVGLRLEERYDACANFVS